MHTHAHTIHFAVQESSVQAVLATVLIAFQICRAENIQLQMKIRELDNCRECYSVVGTVIPTLHVGCQAILCIISTPAAVCLQPGESDPGVQHRGCGCRVGEGDPHRKGSSVESGTSTDSATGEIAQPCAVQ